MGVEARCRPCHSTAHLRHMKRQPYLCHCCPCHGRCHCNRRRHLRHRCRLRRHCRCCCPLPSPLAICCCSCRQSLLPLSLLRHHQPLPSPLPLPSAIAVSITVGHCSCHLRRASPSPSPLAISKSCCLGVARNVFDQLKQSMLILFCFSDSGRCTDQSWMTDQVSSSNGRHQHWLASGKQQAASGGSDRQQGAAGWRR